VALRLGRQLGIEVTPVLTRKELADPASRIQSLVGTMCAAGTMAGAIRVPNTVGDLVVTMDLRAGRVTCHVDVDAPKQGRPTTRVNWLVRQLRDAPEDVRVESQVAYARGSGLAELLRDVRLSPDKIAGDPAKEIKSFRVALSAPLGAKRGRGRGGAIDSVLQIVERFYDEVLSQIKAWTAAPPKLRPEAVDSEYDAAVPAELTSTSLSSQDGPEVATPENALPSGTIADSV
jgi:hypothetical protein